MLYHLDDCVLDEQRYHIPTSGQPMSIKPQVFYVIADVLHHSDRVVSKDELLEKLWPGQVVSETALTRGIVAARKAVGDNGARQEVMKRNMGGGIGSSHSSPHRQ